jgi:hypothetical protein
MKRFIFSSFLIVATAIIPLSSYSAEPTIEPAAAQESTETAKSHLSEWIVIGIATALAATVVLLVAFDKGHDAQAH